MYYNFINFISCVMLYLLFISLLLLFLYFFLSFFFSFLVLLCGTASKASHSELSLFANLVFYITRVALKRPSTSFFLSCSHAGGKGKRLPFPGKSFSFLSCSPVASSSELFSCDTAKKQTRLFFVGLLSLSPSLSRFTLSSFTTFLCRPSLPINFSTADADGGKSRQNGK